jgi:Effector protein
MRKFRNYPIYINYNIYTEAERQTARFESDVRFHRSAESLKFAKEVDTARREGWSDNYYDYRRERRHANADDFGRYHEDIRIESKPSQEAVQFENDVLKQLNIIASTAIGRLLFDCLNPNAKVWISPMYGDDRKNCECGAWVDPWIMKKEEGGGVRMHYNPKDHLDRADDILFHEMIHAYRGGWVPYTAQHHIRMSEYASAEEFIATHLQNVYRSCRGHFWFYRSHNRFLWHLIKEEMYEYFANDVEVVEAFRYFLAHEPLASRVAKMKEPEFNPWRDFAELERMFRGRDPYLSIGNRTRLPPLQ